MRSLSGRQKVLQLFINLTRWLHTVHALSLLPPPPAAILMKTFFRPSPYSGECPSLVSCWPSAVCNVAIRSAIGFTLILCLQSTATGRIMVKWSWFFILILSKRHSESLGNMQELLDVYGLLHTLKLTGAIQCARLLVSIHLKQHLNSV